MLKLVSLYSGAGGLDLGLEAAGFKVCLCVENENDCIKTLNMNRPNWKIADPPDVFKIKALELLKQAGGHRRSIDLLAGGPPCQPFSKAAYWHNGDSLRLRDPRAKTLDAYMKIVETLLPKVILLENVEGINFSGKDEGLRLLKRKLKKINAEYKTQYAPIVFTINAADFGVPQIRKRIFLVASREGKLFTPPMPTHGKGYIPYTTAWDAIGDLENTQRNEDLRLKGTWTGLLPSVPEGRNYLWHTNRGGGEPIFGFRTRFWSFLLKLAKDKPSWTIPAQPGPATGPFHWNNRLLSIHELARLQTFPDSYRIYGVRQSAQKQIGNAVPPLIGEQIGRELRKQLLDGRMSRKKLEFALSQRQKLAQCKSVEKMLFQYRSFIGEHAPHPGIGKGPGVTARTTITNSL